MTSTATPPTASPTIFALAPKAALVRSHLPLVSGSRHSSAFRRVTCTSRPHASLIPLHTSITTHITRSSSSPYSQFPVCQLPPCPMLIVYCVYVALDAWAISPSRPSPAARVRAVRDVVSPSLHLCTIPPLPHDHRHTLCSSAIAIARFGPTSHDAHTILSTTLRPSASQADPPAPVSVVSGRAVQSRLKCVCVVHNDATGLMLPLTRSAQPVAKEVVF